MALSGGLRNVRKHMRGRGIVEVSSSPGCVGQQQLRHDEVSLLWPSINNVALVLFCLFPCFFYFRKTCSFCRVVFFKVA